MAEASGYATGKLPARERVRILTARIAASKAGAGEYHTERNRQQAIDVAQSALDEARGEIT